MPSDRQVVENQLIDELILKAISQGEVDTVLNLGAGLDTRPYRLPLPSWLRWIDSDLPGILNYKIDPDHFRSAS